MQLPEETNKFVLCSGNREEAKYVLIGVPEESGSAGFALATGSAKGPAAIRASSQFYNAFHRKENGQLKTFITNSFCSINQNESKFPLVDIGDVQKSALADLILSLIKQGKMPITLGGDHSLTYEVLRGVNELNKEFAVVYFDAHPDFRSLKDGGSFATVMYDAVQLPFFDAQHSIQVGVRDIEHEEFINSRQAGVAQLTSLDIDQLGIRGALNKIKEKIGDLPIYISFDLDVVDCAYAPGVSTPSPCGLTSREALFLLTGLASSNIVGFDMVEHVPNQDVNNLSSNLAARLIIEFVVRNYYSVISSKA